MSLYRKNALSRLFAMTGSWVVVLGFVAQAVSDDEVADSSGDVQFFLISDEAPVPPAAPALQGSAFADALACDGGCADLVYPIRFRGAFSYYSVPLVETKLGGTYGIDTIHQVTSRCGFYGAAKVNHVRAGTQLLASGGLYKMADPCACELVDRIGYVAIVDYFDDSRQSDLEFTQLRMQVGVPLNCDWSAGVAYTQPFDDEAMPLLFLNNGGVLEPTEFVAGYVSGYAGDHLVYAAAGYREVSDTMYFDASIRTPCRGNVFRFVDAHYEERGRWIALVGLEYRFGTGGCGSSCAWNRNHCSPWDDPTIAEAFNSGEAKTWGRDIDRGEPVVDDVPEG